MAAGTVDITLALPRSIVQKLEQAARAQQITVADVVADALDHVLPAANELPPELLAQLLSMMDLSDTALQAAAVARLDEADDSRLRQLVLIGHDRPLTADETAEMESLVARWQEAVIRRSQALMLLERRGYDAPLPDGGWSGAAA